MSPTYPTNQGGDDSDQGDDTRSADGHRLQSTRRQPWLSRPDGNKPTDTVAASVTVMDKLSGDGVITAV